MAGIKINDAGESKDAVKVSENLYLAKESDIKGEWFVICPDCFKVLNKQEYFPSDDDLNVHRWLRRWADKEVKYHQELKECIKTQKAI